jgi:uncharacterized protein YndB with AHSA1/START domain
VTDIGRYEEIDGRPAVRLERIYPHPIARVWSALTEPGELRHWFPSSVELDLVVGGTIRYADDPYATDLTGTVLAVDPPRHLAFTWNTDELRFDLEELGPTTCRFVLTNLLTERDAAARNASGWVVCLAELDKHVAGEPSKGPHSEDALAFQPVYDAHMSAGLPWGAEIPTGGPAD